MSPEEVRGYVLGTVEEWFGGYFGEGPQYRARLADYDDDWADFTVTPMGRYGPEDDDTQRFRVRVLVEETT